VFLMIFSGMQLGDEHRQKVLKWWILTAIVMRVIFIFAGVELLNEFKFVVYIFGGILLWAAYKMVFWKEEDDTDVASHPVIVWLKKHFRFLSDYTGNKFVVTKDKLIYITPLLVTLILIEISDLVFAVDSIPAVIAISRDHFIVITSNIFAILWLRALYFVVADMVGKFTYLKQWVGTILFYVGIKMMISEFVHIPTLASFGFISLCLFVSIFLSWKKNHEI
jgi:tellurite resistance protein TerC